MIRSEKKLAELRKILGSGKHYDIEESISILRDDEPFEGALRLLALFYDTTTDEGLRLVVAAFFNDMKEQTGRQEIIEAINDVTLPETKAMLASSCWQSGLDYSEYATGITDIYLEGDYMTALECFTVIDNCSGMIVSSDRKHIIMQLEKAIGTFDNAKQKLTKELIAILKE